MRSVDELSLHEQSARIAGILPVLMRSLGSPDDRLSVSLPLAQLRLCRVLYDGPRPMSVLSQELGVSLSALTQMADRLERAKLVARVASGKDRRVRHLQLTERGRGPDAVSRRCACPARAWPSCDSCPRRREVR